MHSPTFNDYPYYFEPYIKNLEYDTIEDLLEHHHPKIISFYLGVPDNMGDYRYAEGKWTIKEVFQHLIDTERVFSYRTLCIARKDTRLLDSMNEELYVKESKASQRSLRSLKEEWLAVRTATNLLFKNFDNEQLNQQGFMAGCPSTVKGIALVIFAHLQHHQTVLMERYMV